MKTRTLLLTALTFVFGLQLTIAQINIHRAPAKIDQAPIDPVEYSDWEMITHTGTQSDFSAIHFSDNDHGWVVAENGTMIYTKDGGLSWEEEYFGPSMHFKDVYFTDNENGFVTGSTDVGPQTKGLVYQTNDGGVTWTLQYISEEQATVDHITFSSDSEGFATGEKLSPSGSEGFVLVTDNAGETWEEYTINLPGLKFNNIHFSNENEGWAVGKMEVGPSEASIILKTENGGRDWNTIFYTTDEVSLKDVSFFDSNAGIAIGDMGSILTTKDAGNNWVQQNFRQFTFNAAFVGDNSCGYVIGDDGVILSTSNNGNNWTQEITLLETSLNAISSTPNGYIWVAGDEGTLYMHQPNSIDPPNEGGNQDVDNGSEKAATILDDGMNQNNDKSNGPLVRHKNYPNPFAAKTTISFELNEQANIRLAVYSINGQLITVLKDQQLEAGNHEVKFDASDLTPGIYTYILNSENHVVNGKMIVR